MGKAELEKGKRIKRINALNVLLVWDVYRIG